jgi:hypothetical protein
MSKLKASFAWQLPAKSEEEAREAKSTTTAAMTVRGVAM